MHKQTELCWNEIVKELKLKKHDFSSPFYVKHKKIKKIVSKFADIPTNKKEIRILGSITKRENKPLFFKENNIFLLPPSNSEWVFLKGDGYFDPQYEVNSSLKKIKSDIKFDTFFGDSEGRYIHQINAQGILNDFTKTKKSVFTISGRRRAKFKYSAYGNNLEANGVQIEVDAGFESRNEIILIEAKIGEVGSEIIRQIYFPFKFISGLSNKKIRNIFMVVSQDRKTLNLFEYVFKDIMVYESMQLVKSEKYKI